MIISLRAKQIVAKLLETEAYDGSLLMVFNEITYAIETIHERQNKIDGMLREVVEKLAKIERDHYRKPIGG